jgi:hypothetical protein
MLELSYHATIIAYLSDSMSFVPESPITLVSKLEPRKRDRRPAPTLLSVGQIANHNFASLPIGHLRTCDEAQTLRSCPTMVGGVGRSATAGEVANTEPALVAGNESGTHAVAGLPVRPTATRICGRQILNAG